MTYKHLFLDNDILLDLLLKRYPFYYYVQALLIESEKQGLKLSTSALAIANINYILSKEIGATETRKKLKELTKVIDVLSFDSDVVDRALDSSFSDIEDAFQCFIAEKYKCDMIVTRNIKDYKQSAIRVLTPEQFLKTL